MTRSKSPSPFRLALTALVGALGIGSLLATGGSGSGGSSGEDTGPGGQPAAPTWAKSFGGPARDYAAAGAARPGGGYVVAGTWNQRGAGLGRIGEPEPLGVESDAWVIALDAFGDVEWQRTYGVRSARAVGEYVSLFEIAAEPDRDGDGSGDGAWVAGYASDVPTVQYFEPGRDLLVARIDAADRLAWTRRHDAGPLTSEDYFFGDEGTSETVLDIDVPADGGLLVAAIAAATVNRNGQATLVQRLWVVRLGPSGDRLWSTFLGNDDDRQPLALPGLVRALPGGGAVAAFDAKGRDGDQRVVVARLDAAPQSIRWQATLVGTKVDALHVVDDRDGDGESEGILVAFRQHNEPRLVLLDANGAEVWRRDDLAGDTIHALTSVCRAVLPRPGCVYVAATDARSPGAPAVANFLAPFGGDTLAVVQLPGTDVPRLVRGLEGEHRVQVLATVDCPVGCRRMKSPIVGFGFEVEAGFFAGVVDEIEFTLMPSIGLTFAGGPGYGFIGMGSGKLIRLDESGGVFEGAPIVEPPEELAGEYAFGVQVVPGAGGTVDGYVLSGMQGTHTWLARLDAQGAIGWQRRLQGFSPGVQTIEGPIASAERPIDAVRPLPDGRFVVSGTDDAAVARVIVLDASGAPEWVSPSLRDPTAYLALVEGLVPPLALRAADDGRLVVAGTRFGGSWAVALDSTEREVLWRKSYDTFYVEDLRLTADGGAVLVGGYRPPERSASDAPPAALRIDASGEPVWAMEYPQGRSETAQNRRIAPAADNGFLLAASVQDAVEPETFGRYDILLLKIGDDGRLQWFAQYGGLYDEIVHGVEALADGGFLVTGHSDSMGDFTEAWVLRVGADGRIADGCNAQRLRAEVVDPVSRPIAIASEAYTTMPDETPPVIEATETNVLVETPSEVVVARQCSGTARQGSGFIPNGRTLIVNQAGSLTGVVTSVPSGIVCGTAAGGACSNVFSDGTLVTLRVDIGSVQDFDSWGEGCETVTGDFAEVCTVRMDGDRVIDVIFGSGPPPEGEFTLEVLVSGLGSGRVTSAPAGIDCSENAICSAAFPAGTQVLLMATPDAGSQFSWGSDSDPDCTDGTVTMDADLLCEARFDVAPPDPLAITTATLPAGTEGTAYSATIGTSGGMAPVTFAVTAGALPPGLALDAGTGTVSGTPASGGSYTFTVEATDSRGPPQTASQSYTVAIAPAGGQTGIGTEARVSVAGNGDSANGGTLLNDISADGDVVVFTSAATNLDGTAGCEVFVRRISTGVTRCAARGLDGDSPNGALTAVQSGISLSPNGNHVAFGSSSNNLVEGDTSDTFLPNIFVVGTCVPPVGPVECLGPLTLVSRMPDGSVPLQGSSQWPAMSNAGLVAFQSNSPLTNLPSQSSQIFLRDIEGDITFLVSAAPDGSPGNNASMFPAITPTGSHVAFASRATNLVAGDSNARSDVFVAESCFTPGCVPTITRVSVNSAGEQQSGGFDDIGFQPVALSDDGRYVAFSSSATNLADLDGDGTFDDDTNSVTDVFLHDRATGETMLVSVGHTGLPSPTGGAMVGMSGDARLVAFTSLDPNLVPGNVDFNDAWQVVVRDTCIGAGAGCTPTTFLLSQSLDGNAGDGDSERPALSADGRYGVLRSRAGNLLPTGNTGGPHIYRATTGRP